MFGEAVHMYVNLVASLGRVEFERSLMAAIRAATGADFVSAFAFPDRGEPFYLLASGCTSAKAKFSQLAGHHYVERFWRSDRMLHGELGRRANSPWRLFFRKSSEIPDEEYRYFCYDSQRVCERASIFYRAAEFPIMLNIYRTVSSGPFGDIGISRMEEAGGVLGALVAKHAEIRCNMRPTGGRPDASTVATVLHAAYPALSEQEVEVCACLISGLSYKEIALKRSLMPSSVVTYRKRAYLKLGVMSRTELISIYERIHRRLLDPMDATAPDKFCLDSTTALP